MSTEKNIDYKNTIKLPVTDFPMKGNLPTKEPEIIRMWEEKEIYRCLQKKNAKGPSFVLPDGPPYANGSIHIGHALNKNLKDIIIKYKNMRGFRAPFIPGWDCHGLPIEHAVMKNLGEKGKALTDSEIRSLCRAEAGKWVNTQRDQFRRLGVLADWSSPYLTMDPAYEAEEVREFARAYKRGVIYLGTKPVYWNWTLKTALADAEVEYHQHKSPSIYVKFPVTDPQFLAKLGKPNKPVFVVIWTTTPWTLPANLGICLNADADYCLFEMKTEKGAELLFFAQALKDSVEAAIGCKLNVTSKETWKGNEFDKMSAHHPFIKRESLIMNGAHVTLDAGTGCVHTAPGHGTDDYKVGLKYGLPILSPVNESGQYTDEFIEMKGTNIFKANPLIVEKLRSLNSLLAYSEFEHSYPHCWRSKTPLIFRATPQWFIGLDLKESDIRKSALTAMNDIQFFPAWGESRFRSMMEGRPDWCLSRQRIWGVPIPILYCNKTAKPLAEFDVMMRIADAMEKEGGIDAFYKHPTEFFLKDIQIPKSDDGFGTEGFRHGKDILDVWFDSGICHAAVQSRREGMKVPADLYLEGSDQHRGWFNTSLLSSIASHNRAPFKALVTHGFVTDSAGMKMSKSKGNTVDPQTVAAQSGAEILRLWSIYEDYGQDLTCGKTELDRVTETYRRIRNTIKFLLGATSDFTPQTDVIEYSRLTQIDQWALAKLYDLVQKITAAYDEYSFYKIYHLLNNFFTVELSSIYLDILKDRLYTWKVNGLPRRSSQTVLHLILDYLTRIMAPVLSFLAEETYSYFKNKSQPSVFLLDYPTPPEQWNNQELLLLFDTLLNIRSEVQKAVEPLRAQKVIGASLEAHVEITTDAKTLSAIKACSDFREILIVSELVTKEGPPKLEVKKAAGEKCVRCWTYFTEVNNDQKFPGICPKCIEALS